MKTIAFYNLKGGVGKTASAVNVAHLAACANLRTLLWDLDPQGAASWYLASDDVRTVKSKKLLKRKVTPAELVVPTEYALLNLIPADFSYREFDRTLQDYSSGKHALQQFIEPFGETHALTVLDCPPSLSRLAQAVFAAADAIFVPVVPTHLSLRAFGQVRDFLKQKKLGHKRIYPFFTMVDLHRNLHRSMVLQPPDALKRLVPSYIPYSSMIEKMGEFRAPVAAFAPTHPAALAYRNLWQDIAAIIA
jgi:cellulose biosynthesis protein BcsQ